MAASWWQEAEPKGDILAARAPGASFSGAARNAQGSLNAHCWLCFWKPPATRNQRPSSGSGSTSILAPGAGWL
jgi:hypothetical protein